MSAVVLRVLVVTDTQPAGSVGGRLVHGCSDATVNMPENFHLRVERFGDEPRVRFEVAIIQ